MTAREILLLRVLGVMVAAALIFLGGQWFFSNLSRLDQEQKLNNQRLSQLYQRQNELSLNPNAATGKLATLKALQDEAASLSQRFIEPGPVDVYAFANKMRALVREYNLSLQQMQIDDVKKRLSVQVAGSTANALSLLSGIEAQEDFLTVWSLGLDTTQDVPGKGDTHMNMVVGYAERK